MPDIVLVKGLTSENVPCQSMIEYMSDMMLISIMYMYMYRPSLLKRSISTEPREQGYSEKEAISDNLELQESGNSEQEANRMRAHHHASRMHPSLHQSYYC